MDYQASNPGGIRIRWGHFFKSDLSLLIVGILAVVIAIAIAFSQPMGAFVALAIGVLVIAMQANDAKTLFAEGDVIPAIVIDPKRRQVAAMADVSKTSKTRNMVRVLQLPWNGLPGVNPKVGTRLAYIVLYNGQHGDCWQGFGGWFAQQGTPDKKAHQRCLNSIPEEQWATLEKAIELLPDPCPYGEWMLSDLKKGLRGSFRHVLNKIAFWGFVSVGLLVAGILGMKQLGGGRANNPPNIGPLNAPAGFAAPQVAVAPPVPPVQMPGLPAGNVPNGNPQNGLAQHVPAAPVAPANVPESKPFRPALVGQAVMVKTPTGQTILARIDRINPDETADVTLVTRQPMRGVKFTDMGPPPGEMLAQKGMQAAAPAADPNPFQPVHEPANAPVKPGLPFQISPQEFQLNAQSQATFTQRFNGPAKVGDSLVVEVVGYRHGTCFGGGGGIYTTDTAVYTAAVHAGLLKDGERGRIKVTMVTPLPKYDALDQHGIRSSEWPNQWPAFRIEKAE